MKLATASSTSSIRSSKSLSLVWTSWMRRSRVGKRIGRLDDETMLRLNRTLAFVVGLAE